MLTRTLTSIRPSRLLPHIIRGAAWQTPTKLQATRLLHSPAVTRRELLRRLRYPAEEPGSERPVQSSKDFVVKYADTRSATEGTAAVVEARALLLRSFHGSQHLSLEEQRVQAASFEASRMLSWLWTLGKDMWEVVLDRDFVELICWHMEAEGKDEFVAEWLRLANKAQARPEDALIEKKGLVWPGETLAGHVKAKLYWHKSPEPAINALFAVLHQDQNNIFFANALVALSRWLTSPYSPVYTREAFARQEKISRINGKGGLSRAICQGHELYHPTDPSADAYLQIWQDHEFATWAHTWKPTAQAANAYALIRAAYIMRLQGRGQDADFLEQHARSCAGLSWKHRFMSRREHRDDPKLEQLHRKSPHVQAIWDAFAREEAESGPPLPSRSHRTKPSQIETRGLDRWNSRARPSWSAHASGTKVFRFSPSTEKQS